MPNPSNVVVLALLNEAAELERFFPIMSQLRPHLLREQFAMQVSRQRLGGYRLVGATVDGVPRGAGGFRLCESLGLGAHLFVEDLVTDEGARGTGVGQAMFDWLVATARQAGCRHLVLDSKVHRAEAHRFYFARGMRITSFHFEMPLE